MKMPTNKILSILAVLLASVVSYAQVVTTEAELSSAINAASSGTTIILADGAWNDVFIDIDKNGTAAAPITITAQNEGAVLMTGNSRVYMEGAYLTVSGLVFQDPSNLETSGGTIEPVIELKQCDNCKIINNKIDSYNGTEAQKTMTYKWVLVDGENNEIAYNSFIGKYGIGSIINDNRNSADPDFLKIHHNYFANRTPINDVNDDNDQDAIRIGNSSTSLEDSNSEVYANYFFNFFGEIEVISNKSGGNQYYNNTFRDYSGTLALRHGDNCSVYGNYFFAEDNLFSGGVRVIGEGHKVYNNYIEGVNSTKPGGSTSNGTGGINVSNGRLNSEVNGYYQVKNAQIINNTFVNCDYALRIGTNIGGDLDQAPENLVVANNIMYNSSANDYQITTEPTGASLSEGNITSLPESDMVDDGYFHRLTLGSSPIDVGIGDYSYLTEDILNGTRPEDFDAGAEEFGSNGTSLPYVSSDVGINVGFGALSNSIGASSSTINAGVCGGVLAFDVFSNVSWTIEEELDWLALDLTAGSGTATVTGSITENSSGEERIGTITINEEVGGDNLSFEISVVQLLTSVTFEIPIVGTTSLGMQISETVSEENAYNDDNTNYWTGNPDSEEEVSITFDLGSEFFLTKIGINFWKADERTTTFSIAISDNPDGPFTTVIDNGISQETEASADEEQLFSLQETYGRYVKFIGLGNSSDSNWSSISNVNLYGDVNCENAAAGTISGLSEYNYQEEGILLFPNPVTNELLTVFSTTRELGSIMIYTITGQRVLIADGSGCYGKEVDVSGLRSGIYFVLVEDGSQAKFVKR